MMNDDTELILTLSEHLSFGWMFHACSARKVGQDEWRILGATDAGREKARGASPEMTAMVAILDDITDRALMRDFSKQKSLLVFLREVGQDVTERFIRPRIERANLKTAAAAGRMGIAVFLRQDMGTNVLYESDRLRMVEEKAVCVFHFVKDKRGFRYFISLACRGREVSLRQIPGIILSDSPCLLLSGREALEVENIEGKKLTPFFDKSHIAIPPQAEALYLKNFVAKTMLSHEVKISGIEVREIFPDKQAFLTLERDLHQRITLLLSFGYGSSPRIYPGYGKAKVVEVEEQPGDATGSGAAAIRWYNRDKEWEEGLADLLLREGLRLEGDNRFYAAEDGGYRLIEWLNERESGLLNVFVIENGLERPYFIDSVRVRPDFEAKIDWFELEIEVVAGAYTLPFSCFVEHIMSKKNEYVLPDGSIFILPSEWFVKYYGLLRYSEEKDGKLRLGKEYASLLEDAISGKAVGEKKRQLVRDILQIPLNRPPLPCLSATLREYQKEGFYWLEHLYKHRFGGCLSDDMGLGKTLQTIALLQHIYCEDDGHTMPASLVVAPTSLLHNWYNELSRFAPGLDVLVYAGDRRLRSVVDEEVEQAFAPFRVIITSYGIMRNDIEFLRGYGFTIVILDESQYVKNPASQSYRAALQLVARHRLTLTGTPIENSLEDLWAQFNFLQDGLLGDLSSFRTDFLQPITKEHDKERETLFKTLISPFLLRRTKEEVTPELPPLVQETVYCDMSEAQQEVYEKEKNIIRNLLFEAKECPETPRNNFVALQWLNKLRQISDHPRLVDAAYEGDSGKFDQVLLSFETIKESRHKALIFSSYVRYLDMLATRFDEEGWQYAMLTGRTRLREEEIRRFNENEEVFCFFISLKAGSTGLNLTAADYVFILDPWWNPAAEMQALSRAHRIGQQKSVIAYRFISTGTVEEKIQNLQASKTALYDTFVSNNNPLSQFTQDEVEELFN
ncbi:MAG: DEAD/DEAH box helicase [Tannerellaceae bacterium]|nr:DEAD/DEAH box helicase [Tannerellaceae bacterium]